MDDIENYNKMINIYMSSKKEDKIIISDEGDIKIKLKPKKKKSEDQLFFLKKTFKEKT